MKTSCSRAFATRRSVCSLGTGTASLSRSSSTVANTGAACANSGKATSLSVRELRSYTHYSLDVEQVQREQLGTNVINEQRAIDLTVTHALSERFAVAVGVPFISASWSIPTPTSPAPGPRAQQDARGIGDISVNGRYWLLDTRTHRTANIAVGAGVK